MCDISIPPNNGMHPTADTLLLKFLQSRGAAVMPGVRRFFYISHR
jgi:hypothetical protein